MSKTPQLSLFFCEDFRVEIGSKPFITGILAPIVYIDSEEVGKSDIYKIVTYGLMPITAEEIDLTLRINIRPPEGDVETRSYRSKIHRDGADPEEPWAFWLPLQIEVQTTQPGLRIEAELDGGSTGAWANVLLKGQNELAPESLEEMKSVKRVSGRARRSGKGSSSVD